MSTNLTHREYEVVRALQDAGMSLQEATLAVVMFTRGHERVENELIHIVGLYPGLEDPHLTEQAVHKLINVQWLVPSPSYGLNVIKVAPDLPARLAAYINNPGLVNNLAQLYMNTNTLPHSIRLIGPTANQHSYGTFLDLLRHAQSEICLPMLVTAPYQETVLILQQRAARGVRVRILLASPQVAVKLREEALASKSKEVIKKWREVAQDYSHMEIRISHRVEDMYHLATSWTLDRKLLRYDFYVPPTQRSLAGYLIEFDSRTEPELKGLNIVHLFQMRFDEAWKQARPTTPFLSIWWWIKQNWQWGAGFVAALLALLLGGSFWAGIMASISATFFFNALVSSWDMIRQAIRNWLN